MLTTNLLEVLIHISRDPWGKILSVDPCKCTFDDAIIFCEKDGLSKDEAIALIKELHLKNYINVKFNQSEPAYVEITKQGETAYVETLG